jgi:hypothetical protein
LSPKCGFYAAFLSSGFSSFLVMVSAALFSGLRCTVVTGAQLRVSPLQRTGARQTEELQQHWIAYKFAWTLAQRRQLAAGFPFDSGAVLASEQAFVVQCADLTP